MSNNDKIILDLCGVKYERKIHLDHKGYPEVSINGRDYKVHVLIWEAINGPKPEGCEIHHIDGNKQNYDIVNLRLVLPSQHGRIHAGWVSENETWIAKPCNKCGKILPLSDFYYISTRNIQSNYCKECHNKLITERNRDPSRTQARREYKRNYYRTHYGKGVVA